ncbi:hypothetical protein NLM27_33900 [Bradyrhizobium sp. CCGB12]|uniref:hypothetical protein n=1 Tax=Bradyrhizobium sp. CCGB12 TaxID=2949632 RepID=UPI0020B1EDC2|nr:hypothetical protein [Bradyrhizobium sp. CCGB12]MCP3393755.1 hypothetical protein [Bradyrhizobium sp. CCGB12]
MSDQQSYLAAIDAEMARLRERLDKLAKFKELAIELGITPDVGVYQPPPKEDRASANGVRHGSSIKSEFDFADGTKKPAAFDGTFSGLIKAYRTHEKSPYHKLKHSVRKNYDQGINRLDREIGSERVADWTASRVQYMHDNSWAAGGKASMGHSLLGKVRLLCSFGSVVLEDDACTRLSTIIGNMRFEPPPTRTEILTYDHARAIRATAHTHFNWPSIALAQALQFEIPKLRQVDVIGQWVPLDEPGPDDIKNEHEKWVGGLMWSDIDEHMILRRELPVGRKGGDKPFEWDLKRLSMIMEEINSVPPWKRTGPMVICEYSNKPWSAAEFRRKWRIVADKAGVPSNIQMTDGARGTNKT